MGKQIDPVTAPAVGEEVTVEIEPAWSPGNYLYGEYIVTQVSPTGLIVYLEKVGDPATPFGKTRRMRRNPWGGYASCARDIMLRGEDRKRNGSA